MNDSAESLQNAFNLAQARRNKQFDDELDSNFNFRCNGELKEEFKRLCKDNQTSPSTVLKRYMLSCIRSSKIV